MDELVTIDWRTGTEHERAARLDAPDLRWCPWCGRADFPLASLERVEAYAPIALAGDRASGFAAAWHGTDEACWETAVTLGYLCRACGMELPEDYAAALDRLLANRRGREG